MKESKHEINKARWRELIKAQSQSGLSIREWCRRNNMSHGQFYYWQRIVREDALIKAGTLALTGQNQFVEVRASPLELNPQTDKENICAILKAKDKSLEIFNGADPNILSLIIHLVGKSNES